MSLQPTPYNLQPNGGQGLLEAILAIAVFGAIAGVLITMAVGGFRGLEQGGEQTEAEALAQLGIEAVRAVRDRAWNVATENPAVRPLESGGQWTLPSFGTETGLGTNANAKFSRTITFSNVCRDATDAIAACPASYTDPHTKEVVSSVSWLTRGNVNNTVEKRAYITNWDSKDNAQGDTSQGLNCLGGATGGICASVQYSTTLGDGSSITLTPQ